MMVAEPVALSVRKGSREVVVAKIVPLDGESVLAIAIRHQRGTERVLSLPLAALTYAEHCGVGWLYRRDDRTGEMGRIRLSEMRAIGRIGGPDGELYVSLSDLEPRPWRAWPYAETTIRLDKAPRAVQGRLL